LYYITLQRKGAEKEARLWHLRENARKNGKLPQQVKKFAKEWGKGLLFCGRGRMIEKDNTGA
jgi:hypothetical protein